MSDSQCAWNDHGYRCGNGGVFSESLTGGGPWYCREHDAKRRGHRVPASPAPEADPLDGHGITERQPGESSRAYQQRAMAYVRAHIAGIGAARQGRQREWAQRILDRFADGDPGISDYAYRSACEALGFDPQQVRESVEVAA